MTNSERKSVMVSVLPLNAPEFFAKYGASITPHVRHILRSPNQGILVRVSFPDPLAHTVELLAGNRVLFRHLLKSGERVIFDGSSVYSIEANVAVDIRLYDGDGKLVAEAPITLTQGKQCYDVMFYPEDTS
jgi:hypothetical protein